MIQRNNKANLLRAQHELATIFPDYTAYAYDLCMLRSLRSLGFEPATVYDIGASDGIWSYLANWVFPKATFELFDPLAYEDKYNHSRTGHRGLHRFFDSAGVRLHEVVLGGKDAAEGGLTVFPGLVGSTTLPLDYATDESEIRRLPVRRLDSYTDAKRLPKPDLIKLDTQGSELDILRGATHNLAAATAVLCECWFFQGYGKATPLWLDVAKFLRQQGFEIFDFGWIYRRPSDQRPATVDILFLHRNAKISPLRDSF